MNERGNNIPAEIYAVLNTGILKFVLMDWLNWRAVYITAAILFWTFFIYVRYKNNPEVIDLWGIRKKNFLKSMRKLLPFGLIAGVVILAYGYANNVSYHLWHIIPVLIFYPLWGAFQQFIVAGIVAGNLDHNNLANLSKTKIIIIVSFLFALMHAPHWILAGYVFIMEVVFLSVFLPLRNIWALGIYHGVVSTLFLYFISGRDLFKELYAVFI